MKDFLFQQILSMQYTIALLLAVVSFQAARVFRTAAFRLIAFGWLANLAYLFASLSSIQHKGLPIGYVDMSATASGFDFISNSLFWYSAHKFARRRNPL